VKHPSVVYQQAGVDPCVQREWRVLALVCAEEAVLKARDPDIRIPINEVFCCTENRAIPYAVSLVLVQSEEAIQIVI